MSSSIMREKTTMIIRIFEGILDIEKLKISWCENLIWVIKGALMKKLPYGANLKRDFFGFLKTQFP